MESGRTKPHSALPLSVPVTLRAAFFTLALVFLFIQLLVLLKADILIGSVLLQDILCQLWTGTIQSLGYLLLLHTHTPSLYDGLGDLIGLIVDPLADLGTQTQAPHPGPGH